MSLRYRFVYIYIFISSATWLVSLSNAGEAKNEEQSVTVDKYWKKVISSNIENDSKKADPIKVNRFLGFLEGKLNSLVPEFWENALLGATLHKDSSISFEFGSTPEDVLTLQKKVSLGNSFTTVANRIFYKNKEVSIPPDMITDLENKGYVSCHDISKYLYFAVHSGRCTQYNLYCISERGGVIWKKTVSPATSIRNYSGIGEHIVSIFSKDDKIFLFGCGLDIAYMQIFSKEGGKILFRFSTDDQKTKNNLNVKKVSN